MNAVIYIHGKDGSAAESEHYKPLFPDYEVIGLDYRTFSPWDTGREICNDVKELKSKYVNVVLIANSIGAFFSMNAGIDDIVQMAYFISPIVDMEKLITDMMKWANVTESELESEGIIHTDFGEDLSWEYLCYVRNHPITWSVPTQILYLSRSKKCLVGTDPASIKYLDENELLERAEDPEKFYIEVIMQEKIKLYLEYVEKQSFLYDIALIFKTFWMIVNRKSE